MKKFIALAAVVLVSMATTTMYAQESIAEKRADRKAQNKHRMPFRTMTQWRP